MKIFLFCLTALLCCATLTQTSLACPSCYGAKDSPMTAGMNTAILVMLGITGVVLSFIVAFFLMMWKRYRNQQKLVSDHTFVNEEGVLQSKNEKGVAEWNIF